MVTAAASLNLSSRSLRSLRFHPFVAWSDWPSPNSAPGPAAGNGARLRALLLGTRLQPCTISSRGYPLSCTGKWVTAVITGLVAVAVVGTWGGTSASAQTPPPGAPAQPACTFTFPGPPPAPTPSPVLTATVSTDRPAYAVGETVTFTLTVTNPTDAPVTLEFGGWPGYDFAVTDAATGAEVWRWPVPRTRAIVSCTFAPGETITFPEQWSQRTYPAGEPVPAGEYRVTGMLLTIPERLTAGPVSFTIRQASPPTLSLSTDKTTYPVGEPVTFTVRLTNPNDLAITLQFSSGNCLVLRHVQSDG